MVPCPTGRPEALSDFVYDPLSSDLPGCLYDVYRELRDRHPVHHNPQRGF